jgi:hypothetical protein
MSINSKDARDRPLASIHEDVEGKPDLLLSWLDEIHKSADFAKYSNSQHHADIQARIEALRADWD